MSPATSESAVRSSNPLFLPMLIVSAIAAVEAIALVIVVVVVAARGPAPAPPVAAVSVPSTVAPTPPAAVTPIVTPAKAPPAATEPPRGKRGQRVESAGLGITIEKIDYEPTYKGVGGPGPEQRYFALLMLIENNTGGNAMFFPTSFRLQDSQGYEYQPLPLNLKSPKLDWRTMGNRETVRGYIDFVVPKSAKGLTLVYTHLPRAGSQPIRIDLNE